MNHTDPVDADRFHSNYERGNPDECWLWNGSKGRHNRGVFSIAGKSTSAPRVALMLAGKPPPTPYHFACHTCDVPACVNPNHLWWGTNVENIQDCARKRRMFNQTKAHRELVAARRALGEAK